MQRRFVRFLLLIVALATVASACSPAAVEARLTPTSGGGSYRPPPPPLGDFQRLGTIKGPPPGMSSRGVVDTRTGSTMEVGDQLWVTDLSTGQSQLVMRRSSAGSVSASVGPHPVGGDEAKVYFSASVGRLWNGVHLVADRRPVRHPAAWPAVARRCCGRMSTP